jgi:hypothetical protein
MTTDETTTVQTTTRDLAVLLGATIPFADDVEYGVPGLAAIQLHAGDGMITASATNRYVVGHARKNATTSEPMRFVLDVDDARHLRKRLSRATKTSGTGQLPVNISVTTGARRALTVNFGRHAPTTLTFTETHTASAPDFKPIFEKNLVEPGTVPDVGPVGLTATALVPVSKAAKWGPKGDPLRWSFGDSMKPIRVEMGDWFLALVMPARIGDQVKPVEYAVPGVPAPEGMKDEPTIPTADKPAVVRGHITTAEQAVNA